MGAHNVRQKQSDLNYKSYYYMPCKSQYMFAYYNI